jgi:hypothetical protein
MSDYKPPNPPLSKDTKNRLGIHTPIDAINELVDDTIGDNVAGTAVKTVGAGVAVGAFALAVGASAPIAAVTGAGALGATLGKALFDASKKAAGVDYDEDMGKL